MNVASAIAHRFKTGLKPSFRAYIHPSSFKLQTPLSPPETPSHPVHAPRLALTRPGSLKSNFLAAKAVAKAITVAVLILTSFESRAVDVSGIPFDQVVDAPEVNNLFANHRKGNLFTVNIVPVPNNGRSHAFQLPGAGNACEYKYSSAEIIPQRGQLYIVVAAKMKKRNISGREILTVMVQFAKVSNGSVSTVPEDTIMYRCEFDVTGGKIFDEETFYSGIAQYFHSVAHEKRYGRKKDSRAKDSR